MLGRKKKRPQIHFDTLISDKTTIVGDVRFRGGLHVDGHIQGQLQAEDGVPAAVRISEVGRIDGDIRAARVIINGTVIGNVYATEHLELASKASIKGDVYYGLIEMAMGAEVNGSLIHHIPGATPRALPEGTSPSSSDDYHSSSTNS